MKLKNIVAGSIFLFLGISTFFVLANNPLRAQDSSQEEQGNVSSAEISKKLDNLLQNQSEILRELRSIREELKVIKVRSTR